MRRACLFETLYEDFIPQMAISLEEEKMRFKKQNMRRAVGNEAEAGVSSSSVLIVILQVR